MEPIKPLKTVIPKAWNIPQIFKNRLGQDVGRQRLMSEEGHLLAVVHEMPKKEDKGIRKPVLFWVNDSEDWKSMPRSGGKSAMKQHVQDYLDKALALDLQLEKMGGESVEDIHEVIDSATPLLRAVRNMASVMKDLRIALPNDRDVLAIRDMSVEAERATDLLLADAKSSLDFLIAKNASRQAIEAQKAANEARKLNRLAALFFPLVTLASLFGINAPREVFSYPGTVWVIIIGLLLGIILWLLLGKKEH
jgi:Mg2+ and Co2+ transporter CorA